MRMESASVRRVSIELRTPYKVSQLTMTAFDPFILQMEKDVSVPLLAPLHKEEPSALRHEIDRKTERAALP